MTKDIRTKTLLSSPIKSTKSLENRTNTTNIATQVTVQTQTTGINKNYLFGFLQVTEGNEKANQEAKAKNTTRLIHLIHSPRDNNLSDKRNQIQDKIGFLMEI